MRLLLMPCHSVLEFLQVKLFTEMGHECFSIGSYINPNSPHDNKRPAIPEGKYMEHFVSMASVYSKDNLAPAWVDWADVIIVDHIPDWLLKNWPLIKHKKVVWRTIGQSIPWVENALAPLRSEGLLVVRYSPKEATIPGYIGHDAIIRFHADPAEFNKWTGSDKRVMTVAQHMKARKEFCHSEVFKAATSGLPRIVYGPGNEDWGGQWGGCPDYDGLRQAYRDNACFFFTGTQPASYTLSYIEAAMSGIPIVAIGPVFGNSLFGRGQDTYEVHELIQNGVNGFWSDNIAELHERCEALLNDRGLAMNISQNARKAAIETFGKEHIRSLWEKFFRSL